MEVHILLTNHNHEGIRRSISRNSGLIIEQHIIKIIIIKTKENKKNHHDEISDELIRTHTIRTHANKNSTFKRTKEREQ